MTRCADQHKGKSGQGDYNDVMVAHDEYSGTCSASWMNWASPTILSSCTQPTAAPTTIVGLTPGLRRFAAGKILTGRTRGGTGLRALAREDQSRLGSERPCLAPGLAAGWALFQVCSTRPKARTQHLKPEAGTKILARKARELLRL
jgi:hypothetical protein